MNAITPANEVPPDHRTAASGTLPTEQTKLSTAAGDHVLECPHRSGGILNEQEVEEVVAQRGPRRGA